MIKSPDSLGKWLDEISKYKFTDATQLPNFEYENKEFDNIPQIIPRFLFHLNSQIRCISQHLNELSLKETTEMLRKDLTQRHDGFYKEFMDFKETDFYQVEGKVGDLHNRIEELKIEIEVIKNNQLGKSSKCFAFAH